MSAEFEESLRELRRATYVRLVSLREGRALLELVKRLRTRGGAMSIVRRHAANLGHDPRHRAAILRVGAELRAAKAMDPHTPRALVAALEACAGCIEIAYCDHTMPLLWTAANLLTDTSVALPADAGATLVGLRERLGGFSSLLRADWIAVRDLAADPAGYDIDPVEREILTPGEDDDRPAFTRDELLAMGARALKVFFASQNVVLYEGLVDV